MAVLVRCGGIADEDSLSSFNCIRSSLRSSLRSRSSRMPRSSFERSEVRRRRMMLRMDVA